MLVEAVEELAGVEEAVAVGIELAECPSQFSNSCTTQTFPHFLCDILSSQILKYS